MKKVFILAAFVLGTTAMVNAQTPPAKAAVSKEAAPVKKMKKAEKKAEVTKTETEKPVTAAKPEMAKKK